MSEPNPDPLRAALNAVVTKTTWRPDNTVLIHDGTAWNTLVGRIVMATNGDAQPAPALDLARVKRLQSAHHRLLRVTAVTCDACRHERALAESLA